MIGLILCAGKGTRMKPLSDVLPKPLLPIDGIPVITHTINSMIDLGIDPIGIVIQNEDYTVFQRFMKRYYPDTEIDIFIQKELTGIVTAIQSATKYKNQRLLVCAGDTKFNKTHIQSFLDLQEIAEIIIGITQRSKHEMVDRSNIIIDEDNFVLDTIEKPRMDQIGSPWSGVPIWMFNGSIWPYFQVSKRSSNNEYAVEGVITVAKENRDDILAVEVNGTVDITTPEDVLIHNFEYINQLGDFSTVK